MTCWVHWCATSNLEKIILALKSGGAAGKKNTMEFNRGSAFCRLWMPVKLLNIIKPKEVKHRSVLNIRMKCHIHTHARTRAHTHTHTHTHTSASEFSRTVIFTFESDVLSWIWYKTVQTRGEWGWRDFHKAFIWNANTFVPVRKRFF